MSYVTEYLTFTVPLASESHQLAEQFCRRQSKRQNAKRVYLNTLAVYAVNFYLQCIKIETDWEASDSWNPVRGIFMDVADLAVKNRGKLECRPLLPDSQVVHVPPEVWSNRIGYVAVQLSESLREATLLKFTKTVSTLESDISNWQSLEDLLECLWEPKFVEIPVGKMPVKLSQWFQNVFDVGWQTVEEIIDTFNTQEANLDYSFGGADRFREIPSNSLNAIPTLIDLLHTSRDKWTRLRVADLLGHIATGNEDAIAALTNLLQTSQDDDTRRQAAVSLGKIDPNNSVTSVRRARVIDLGMQLHDYRVALVITLMPEADNRTNIHLRVYATNGQILPHSLQLIVLDEGGEPFLEAQSRNADNWIQLEFSGDSGDPFMVKLALGDAEWQEEFVI